MVACSGSKNDCQQVDGLLASAERALRGRLGSSDLEGVLPESETCTTDVTGQADPDRQSAVRACESGANVELKFFRVAANPTIESLVAERITSPPAPMLRRD
jgi:hypothetical protein